MAAGLKIGLFGGTFDPPHRAHLALAEAALEHLQLDAVWWIPAGQPWQKSRPITDALHRVAMLERTLVQAREPSRHRIERCEIDREGPSYMVDTVQALAQRLPQAHWTLILGWDQLCRLPTWHRWQTLVASVRLAVAVRPEAGVLDAGLAGSVPSLTSGSAPASQIPGSPQPPPGVAWTALPVTPMWVSSTAIRAQVARGESLPNDVVPDVARYIAAHGLYRQANG